MNTRRIKKDYTKYEVESDEDVGDEEPIEFEAEYLDEALEGPEFVSFDVKSESNHDYSLDEESNDEPAPKKIKGVTVKKLTTTKNVKAATSATPVQAAKTSNKRRPKDNFSNELLKKLENIEKLLVTFANTSKTKAIAAKQAVQARSPAPTTPKVSVKRKPKPAVVEPEQEVADIEEELVESHNIDIDGTNIEYTIENMTEFDDGSQEPTSDLKRKYNFPLKSANAIVYLNERVHDDADCATEIGDYFKQLRQEYNGDLPQMLSEIATDSALAEADNEHHFNAELVASKLFTDLFYNAVASKRLTLEKFTDDIKKELRKCKNRHMYKMAK